MSLASSIVTAVTLFMFFSDNVWFSTKKFTKSINHRSIGKLTITVNTGIYSFAKYYHELTNPLDINDDIYIITTPDNQEIGETDVIKLINHVESQLSTIRLITGMPFHYEGITKREGVYCIDWGS